MGDEEWMGWKNLGECGIEPALDGPGKVNVCLGF